MTGWRRWSSRLWPRTRLLAPCLSFGPSADRMKILYWDGSGLVMAYKRLEDHGFTWPAIRDGAMTLHRAQFEALFAGLDWRKVRALETRRPECAE